MATISMLMVSYCFPPVSSPESFVTAKIMGALDGIDVDVLSADASNFNGQPDPSLDSYVNSRFSRIERVSAGWFSKHVLALPQLPLRPDRFMLLNGRVHAKAINMLGEKKYDVLFTRSQYHSAHLVGLRLKAKFPHLPWVASFSDPWVGNEYEKRVPFLSDVSERFSKRVVEKADRLVFPTEGILAKFSMQNPDVNVQAKASVLPHSFDDELYSDAGIRRSGSLKLAYFGNFYGLRRVDPIFAALQVLVREKQGNLLDILFNIYTSSPDSVRRSLLEYPDINDIVKIHDSVNHVTALRKMQESDVLLHLDSDTEVESIFLPSKLVDYIGANRPILTISPKGIAAEITSRVGGVCADISSGIDIARALDELIQKKSSIQNHAVHMDDKRYGEVRKYAVENLGERMKEIILGVL